MQVPFVAHARRLTRRLVWLTAVLAVVTMVLGVVSSQRAGAPSPPGEARPGPAAAEAVVPSPVPSQSPSPTPPAPPAPSPPVPADRPALVQELHGLLVSPGVAGTLAVHVTDAYGRELVSLAGAEPVLPASTQKLLTAAAALQVLGPDHRFRTVLRGTALPDATGIVHGDLVLVGGGDPALASPLYGELVYPARPRTPLEDLADALVEQGVTAVAGSVVGDPGAYPTLPDAEGWFPRYFHDLDARHVTSLTAEAGLVVTYDEPTEDLTVELSPDPVTTAAAVLHDLLVERGITVAGEPRATVPDEATAVHRLASVDSPPLAVLLAHTVRRSDNHMADTILQAVALEVAGEASWEAADRAVRQALAPLDLDWSGVRLADGSGLSRSNRVTAAFLSGLERALYRSEHAAVWSDLMAVAGEEGTLRRRLVGTHASGRFTGKTGTLDDVRAIAGTVHGSGRDRYHLTVVGNALDDPDSRLNVRTLMDNVALVLAADLFDCALQPAGPDGASSWVCAEPPAPRIPTGRVLP